MKNNILKSFLLAFTLVLLGNNTYGQDPAFSQFYSNPLYLNPAFAGANNNGAYKMGDNGAEDFGNPDTGRMNDICIWNKILREFYPDEIIPVEKKC